MTSLAAPLVIVHENQPDKNFTCVSSSSNPPAEIVWSKLVGGRRFELAPPASAVALRAGADGGLTASSTVAVMTSRGENEARYACRLKYAGRLLPISAQWTLGVMCKSASGAWRIIRVHNGGGGCVCARALLGFAFVRFHSSFLARFIPGFTLVAHPVPSRIASLGTFFSRTISRRQEFSFQTSVSLRSSSRTPFPTLYIKLFSFI